MRSLTTVVAGLALVFTGCPEEGVDPVPGPTTTVPDAGTGGAPPDPPRVREVFVRNPFGGPHDNLLADGDFELSIVPEGAAGQHGWIAFKQSGADQPILAETGGLCKSGLRCGRVPRRTILFARGTAAAEQAPHRASIWMKPALPLEEGDEASCNLANVYVLRCADFDFVAELRAADAPADDGWCQFSREVKGSRTGYCLYVDVRNEDVLIDHATLLAAPDLATNPPPPASPLVVSAEVRTTALRIRDIIRGRTPFGAPPPARDAEPARPD